MPLRGLDPGSFSGDHHPAFHTSSSSCRAGRERSRTGTGRFRSEGSFSGLNRFLKCFSASRKGVCEGPAGDASEAVVVVDAFPGSNEVRSGRYGMVMEMTANDRPKICDVSRLRLLSFHRHPSACTCFRSPRHLLAASVHVLLGHATDRHLQPRQSRALRAELRPAPMHDLWRHTSTLKGCFGDPHIWPRPPPYQGPNRFP